MVAGEAHFGPDLRVFEGVRVGGDQREPEQVFALAGEVFGNGGADLEVRPFPCRLGAVVLGPGAACEGCPEHAEVERGL